MQKERQQLAALDRAITEALADKAMPMLRVSLAVIYLWFGALKVLGVSPIRDLVGRTVPFLPQRWVVLVLGVWEMVIGVALLFRVALRPTLLLFGMQLAGTFLTFVTQPARMIQRRNPLVLTVEGEFVLKNIVLLAAGLAVGSTVRRTNEALPAHDGTSLD